MKSFYSIKKLKRVNKKSEKNEIKPPHHPPRKINIIEEKKIPIIKSNLCTNITNTTTKVPSFGVTKLNKLYAKKVNDTMILKYGENEIEHIRTMTAFDTSILLPLTTDCECWWCRHPFDSAPIGLPIKYVSSYRKVSIANYNGTETTVVRQDVSARDVEKYIKEDNCKDLVINDYFETDGIFCSFNCVLSYIEDNRNNYLYKNSKSLLNHLYLKIFKKVTKIIPSPSWKLLHKKGGGTMSIEEFRKSHTCVEYLKNNSVIRPNLHNTSRNNESKKILKNSSPNTYQRPISSVFSKRNIF